MYKYMFHFSNKGNFFHIIKVCKSKIMAFLLCVFVCQTVAMIYGFQRC